MQLMSFLEDGGNLTAYETQKRIPLTPFVKGELIPTTFASTTSNYSQRFPTTLGDTLGILLSNSSGSLNQPVQETTNTDIDLTRTTTLSGYTLIFSKNDTTTSIVTSGSGAYTGSLFTFIYNQRDDLLHNKALASLDSSLVGYWDMETMTGNLLKDLSAYGNDGVLYG